MKRLNILQFFSKKGAFWIGVIVAVLVGCLFPVLKASAYSADSYTPSGATCLLYTYVDSNNSSHEVWADFLTVQGVPNDGNIRVAFCPGRNRPVASNVEYKSYDIGVFQNADGTTYTHKISDYKGLVNVSNVPSNAVLAIPVFSDYEKLQGYIAGTVDISECDNYSELQVNKETVSGVNDSLPYFDSSVMKLNQNDSVTYNSAMSADMQTEFYNMCAKAADKDGTGEDTEHYKAYVEFSASALYANNQALGVFNSTALKLAGTTAPGGKDKLDEIIQFDPAGRVKVSAYSSSNSVVAGALGGSSVGTSLVKAMFSIDNTAPLIAVSVDDITLGDKNTSFPAVVRNLSAPSSISDSSSVFDNILLGGVFDAGTGYTLVGYAADVRIIYYDVSTEAYTASRDTYTYTWTYTTLQNRYGSGTVSYDSDGNIVSKNEFDNLNANIGNNWGPDHVEYDEDILTRHIKNGFGLLGQSGILALSQRVFAGFPVWVWVLIGMLISVNIVVIVFKALRGM